MYKGIMEREYKRLEGLPPAIKDYIIQKKREKAKKEEEYYKKLQEKPLTEEDYKILSEQLRLIRERMEADKDDNQKGIK